MRLLTEGGKTAAVATPTGSWKSLIIQGTAILGRGITITFEPLLSVAADQAQELRKGTSSAGRMMGEAGCVHLDLSDREQQAEAFCEIQDLESSSNHALVVCASAESFQKHGRPWKRLLSACQRRVCFGLFLVLTKLTDLLTVGITLQWRI
jgi:superfamily II DNA helicase RecQ